MKHRFGRHLAVVCTVVAMGIMASTSGASAATHPQKVHSGGTLNIVRSRRSGLGLTRPPTPRTRGLRVPLGNLGELIELQPGGAIAPDEASA